MTKHIMERLWNNLGLPHEVFNRHQPKLLVLFDQIQRDVVLHSRPTPPAAPAPRRFQVGKTYRTKGGRTAQVCNDHGPEITGPYRIFVNGNACWADNDGRFSLMISSHAGMASVDYDHDCMLRGAIEEEVPTASAHIGNLQREMINLQERVVHMDDRLGVAEAEVRELKRWRRSS